MKNDLLSLSKNQREERVSSHLFLLICIIACIAFGIWAWKSTLAIVSVAEGEVVPSSQVKTIQHLEGGIIREIQVREGQRVKAGQSLITLESTASGADVGELKNRITSLKIEIALHDAAANNISKPKFSIDLIKKHPKLIEEALQLFNSRQNSLNDEFEGQKALIAQRQQDIEETTARIRNLKASLELQERQIKISEELLKDQLTNQYIM